MQSSEEDDPALVDPPNSAGRVRLTMRYDVDMEILEVTVDRAEYVCFSSIILTTYPPIDCCRPTHDEPIWDCSLIVLH